MRKRRKKKGQYLMSHLVCLDEAYSICITTKDPKILRDKLDYIKILMKRTKTRNDPTLTNYARQIYKNLEDHFKEIH